MKTFNSKGIKFGFNAVNAGQRNANVEPQVIATSTDGGFRLTPAVTKALNIGHGDYVMFLSNADNINEAIFAKDEAIVTFCEENGLELGSQEANIAIHNEFDMWAIAKGIQEYDSKGNPKKITERLSKEYKRDYVANNFDTILEQAVSSEDVDDETKEALTREGVTKEEQISILIKFVTPSEMDKYKGAKAANSTGVTGSGTTLTFTDANVWNQLKADIKDMATKVNRIFEVDLDDMQTLEISNGYENVTVNALVLGAYSDKEVTTRTKTKE